MDQELTIKQQDELKNFKPKLNVKSSPCFASVIFRTCPKLEKPEVTNCSNASTKEFPIVRRLYLMIQSTFADTLQGLIYTANLVYKPAVKYKKLALENQFAIIPTKKENL